MKKKRKVEKAQDGWLENLLRFEIVVLLFGLIGFYYFLSFSPIRMPKEVITSPRVSLAALPPVSESVVSVQDEVVLQVDSGVESSDSPLEKGAQVDSASDSDSRLDESVTVPPGIAGEVVVTEVDSGDTLPVAVKVIKTVPVKDLITHKESVSQLAGPVAADLSPPVELARQGSLASADPVSVPSRILPTPVLVPDSSATVITVVEAGSYVLQADVHKFSAQLEELGFTVKTVIVKRLTPMYRVLLGPYSNRRKAREMIAVARKMGDQPFLQKSGSGYAVVIGSFYLQASVVAWENMYHEAGFDPQVQRVDLMMPHTLIRLDGPQVNQDPQAALARIRASGFPQARASEQIQP